MNITLPLSEMTTAEKMALIETIWEDIEKNSAHEIEVPEWQAEELARRDQLIAAGEEKFTSLEDLKKEFAKRFE